VKAVPLWQPWASLVAIGVKRVETRSYPPSRFGVAAGDRIAIYATKTGQPKAVEFDWLSRHTAALEDLAVHLDVQTRPKWVQEALPRGAVVCTCVVDRARRVTPAEAADLSRLKPEEFSYGDYDVANGRERWAWVLRDVELFTPPVPATTRQQGAFDWPPKPEAPAAPPAQGALL
jgi:hypothetical protein